MRRCAVPSSTTQTASRGPSRTIADVGYGDDVLHVPNPKVRHGAHAGTRRRRRVAIGKRSALQPQRDAVRHATAAGRRRGDIDRGHGRGVGRAGNGIELDVGGDARLDQQDVGLVDVRRQGERGHVDDVGHRLARSRRERPRTVPRSWWRRRRCSRAAGQPDPAGSTAADRRSRTAPPPSSRQRWVSIRRASPFPKWAP